MLYLRFMSTYVRKLAVMLLVVVLPWQAVASMPTALHHHEATVVEADAASAHHAGAHHDGRTGANSAHDHESGSTGTAQGTCTDICCAAALVADATLPIAAADHHGLTIPFATHRLPSRAPDLLERPPRNSLV